VGTGAGLGLAQVWGIVKQHEGHIHVDTAAGKGTTFVIHLPAAELLSGKTLTEDGSIKLGRSERILVVEDSPQVRESLVEALKSLNYRADTAAHGREAIDLIVKEGADPTITPGDRIALVLTDNVMPEMGGTGLLHALNEMEWAGPVVMMTGHPMQDIGEQHGFAACLQKPISLENLSDVLSRTLRGSGPGWGPKGGAG
jgi:CheY-like chemotaxis protein